VRLTNTSALPTERVREVIAFVKPANVSGLSIRLTESRCLCRGRAYWSRGYCLVRVNTKRAFPAWYHPYQYGQHKGRKWWCAGAEEVLVLIMAHELRHFWQAKVPRGWRAWGSKGQFSEIDTEAYAIRMLRAWRRR
jgi:hypothetical protein